VKPVLFVTNHAPPFRVGAFRALDAAEGVDFALIGGDVRHGGGAGSGVGRHVSQRDVYDLAASGRYRAVVAGLSGRLAPAAAWMGARRARIPFVLWATLWSHPRTAPHLLSYLPVRHLYRDADAIVTYGPHVSAYVQGKGARGPVFEAPQSVDNGFWNVSVTTPGRISSFQACFAGRLSGEKGLAVLLKAWRASGLLAPAAALVLVGDGPFRARTVATCAGAQKQGNGGPIRARTPISAFNEPDASGIHFVGAQDPAEVRNFYGGSDVVVVPSVPTADFQEPWGLVVNEAFNQGVPVIATDAVGAVAGGLVRHEENGLVVRAGDAAALASAIRRLHDEPELRARLGAAAREAVGAYTHEAWAAGFSRGLDAVGVSRGTASNQRSDL
jgi:glycosyltransferase involved in cell wall biosynthesis